MLLDKFCGGNCMSDVSALTTFSRVLRLLRIRDGPCAGSMSYCAAENCGLSGDKDAG